jgi:decaprenyl-phosphate phosphoribosyltransferase
VLLRACRPRQWAKNLLVVIAPGAAGVLTRTAVLADVIVAFVAFCLLSSATYLVNDVRDREQDRRHPSKRTRPVASGQLSPATALRLAGAGAALGVTLGVAIRPSFGAVAVCYLALTTSYSFLWRNVVIADIVVIAAGFVLRAVAGGLAAGVALSYSFLLVTSACALFVVAGKRHAELDEVGARSATRATLHRYSRSLLRWLLVAAALLGCLAYARWAFARPELGPWYELSMVPFVLWLGRYAMLLGAGAGQEPAALILQDRALLALSALWVVLFACGVYGAR